MSESSFEEIEADPYEIKETNDKETNDKVERKVELELPDELLKPINRESQRDEGASSQASSSFVPVNRMSALGIPNKSQRDEGDSSLSSSSFVPANRMGALGIQNNSDAASWLYQSDYTMQRSTSVGSSVISGFDILDIGGFSMKRCHLDGYMNTENSTFCEGCGAALVANPCIDVDHQIAIQLQRKEEEEAFQKVQEKEKKRKRIAQATLFQQAETLSDQVEACVKAHEESAKAVAHVDLVLGAARFLECARKRIYMGDAEQIYLGFTCCANSPKDIRELAKGDSLKDLTIFKLPEDAIEYWKQYRKPLFTIPEEETDGKDDNDTAVLFIVAAAPGNLDGHSKYRPQKKTPTTTAPDGQSKKSEDDFFENCMILHDAGMSCLALVCCKSSQASSSETAQLFFNLEELCLDFFADALKQQPMVGGNDSPPADIAFKEDCDTKVHKLKHAKRFTSEGTQQQNIIDFEIEFEMELAESDQLESQPHRENGNSGGDTEEIHQLCKNCLKVVILPGHLCQVCYGPFNELEMSGVSVVSKNLIMKRQWNTPSKEAAVVLESEEAAAADLPATDQLELELPESGIDGVSIDDIRNKIWYDFYGLISWAKLKEIYQVNKNTPQDRLKKFKQVCYKLCQPRLHKGTAPNDCVLALRLSEQPPLSLPLAFEKVPVDDQGLPIMSIDVIRREIFYRHKSLVSMQSLMRTFGIGSTTPVAHKLKFFEIVEQLCYVHSNDLHYGKILKLKQQYYVWGLNLVTSTVTRL